MSIQHQLRYLRYASFGKIGNVFLLKASYFLSKWFKKNWHLGMPMSASIEPTTSCNLRCPECPSGIRSFSRPVGNLKMNFFDLALQDFKKSLLHLNFYFQGEPFLNKSLLEMVGKANQLKIFTSTSTNAHFLDRKTCDEIVDSGLDRLIISIDGTSQEVYEQYRKEGKLNLVIKGTKEIIEAKKRKKSCFPEVVFQFLVVRPNEHQIEEVKLFGKELGVDRVSLKTAQVYDYENGNDLIPINESYSRYRLMRNGKYQLRNKLSNDCWRMWAGAVVTWDGAVVPCCFDKDAKHQMGKISNDSRLKDIWKGESYGAFRKQILLNRKEIDICKNCSEGSKIWVD